jgi:hypothetical protein
MLLLFVDFFDRQEKPFTKTIVTGHLSNVNMVARKVADGAKAYFLGLGTSSQALRTKGGFHSPPTLIQSIKATFILEPLTLWV